MKRKYLRQSLVSLGAIMIAGVGVAHAQDSAASAETAAKADNTAKAAKDQADTYTTEEIVVTARMRAENVQKVPVSDTVFTSTKIEDARITRAEDFINLTPNVTLAKSQGPGVSFITIRGLANVRNGEPPIAVVVDGIQQTNQRQFTQELFDIDRIEILRGPQGALYGRNASGGAIIIQTKQPTDEFEGYAQAGFGKGNELSIQGSVSGPIVKDAVRFRLAAKYLDRKGYFDNIYLGEKADPYEDFTVRGLVTATLSDRLTADVRASVSRSNASALNFAWQAAILDANGFATIGYDFSRGDANEVRRQFSADYISQGKRAVDEFSLKLDYDLGGAVLTSISAYNHIDESLAGDAAPYTAELGTTTTTYRDVDTFSQELRLTSDNSGPFEWMVGAYYLKTDLFSSNAVSTDLGKGMVLVKRAPLFDNPINPTISFLGDNNNNAAWALFGNVNYNVADNLELSLALRYDNDLRRQDVSKFNTGGVPGAKNRATFDRLQPKVTVRYDFSDDANAYASWGRGFRSGQFNQNGVAEAGAAAGIAGAKDVVDQENTETYEVGFKSTLFDGRLRLNGALYQTNVDNQFYFAFIPALSAQINLNIDKVRIRGGELEAALRLAPGLDINGALGITNSKIRAYTVNPSAVGNWAPYVPNSTINLGAQYRVDLSDNLGLFTRIDYERRGKQYWSPENLQPRNALNLVNVRAGFEDPAGAWSLIASVQNITDVVYNSEYVLGGFANAGEPRVWRLDLRVNF